MNLQWLDDCKTRTMVTSVVPVLQFSGVRNSEALSPKSHKETIGFAEKEELCM